jgi:M6 family metalloprotease-like protein
VRAIFIPVAFQDMQPNGDPMTLFRRIAEGTHEFYQRASGGRVNFHFDVLTEWVQVPENVSAYGLGTWSGGNANGYYTTVARAADPFVDYSKYDVAYFLSPTNVKWEQIAYGPAYQFHVQTSDGILKNGTISGADAYRAPATGWQWAAHETGHLFGMYDLYTFGDEPKTYGSWDLMEDAWTNEAIELNAWNRFTQDWLAPEQYVCLESSGLAAKDYTLVPMGSQARGQKAVFIKLSDSKVLVIESRRNAGLDLLGPSREGILVYTVESTNLRLGGHFKVQRRPGSLDYAFTDAALRPGDVITVAGIRIEVPANDANTVKVSKP